MGDFPPFATIVDGGDLEPCCEVLARLGREWARANAADLAGLVWPTDLLISNPVAVPRLAGVPAERRRDAAWLCAIEAHTSPREVEELRARGVHFVVRRAADGSLDRELLRLLFLQLAYSGAERRGCQRMLCWHEACYVLQGKRTRARLLDLSVAACRVLSDYSLSRGTEAQLFLPEELTPQSPSAYRAVVARSSPLTRIDGRRMVSLIFEFVLTKEQRAALEYIMSSQARSPRVQSLNPIEREDLIELEEDRRREDTRHRYVQRVAALTYFDADAPRLVRGRELSAGGIRIEPTSDLRVGDAVTLALHRGRIRPPLRLGAHVERDDGERGLWLRFGVLLPGELQELRNLLAELPALESIANAPATTPSPHWLASVEPWLVQRPSSIHDV